VLYVEPSQNYLTPDKEDMSGLHLLREGQTTIVYSVDEESPAFDQGIKPKDVVEMVNGQNTSSMTMRTIRRMLKSNDGDKVTLQVRRGDSVLNVTFALKKAI
jgi:C-terminal processing protease CtpA/Prc